MRQTENVKRQTTNVKGSPTRVAVILAGALGSLRWPDAGEGLPRYPPPARLPRRYSP
jgi:hypothetical protein